MKKTVHFKQLTEFINFHLNSPATRVKEAPVNIDILNEAMSINTCVNLSDMQINEMPTNQNILNDKKSFIFTDCNNSMQILMVTPRIINSTIRRSMPLNIPQPTRSRYAKS